MQICSRRSRVDDLLKQFLCWVWRARAWCMNVGLCYDCRLWALRSAATAGLQPVMHLLGVAAGRRLSLYLFNTLS
jgi:hypothetical protein